MWVDMKRNFCVQYLASLAVPRRNARNYQLDGHNLFTCHVRLFTDV